MRRLLLTVGSLAAVWALWPVALLFGLIDLVASSPLDAAARSDLEPYPAWGRIAARRPLHAAAARGGTDEPARGSET